MSKNKKKKSEQYDEIAETLEQIAESAETAFHAESEAEPQPEAEEPEAAAEAQQPEAAEPQPEATQEDPALKEALAKQEEYLTLAQRIQADFENFRRRNRNVRAEAFDEGAAAFATTLLPVLDNLERAIAAAQNTSDESLKVGVEMVYRQLCDCFSKRGITVIDRKGEMFDPKLENAVMQGTAEDGEPGTVCEVFQKGYMLGESVLRHAMVKVVPQ